MKRLVAFAAVAVIGLISADSAAAQGDFRIGLSGGSTLALGNARDESSPGAGDGLNNGPHGMVSLQWIHRASGFGIQVDGMFHRIHTSEEQVLGGGATVKGVQVINGTINAVYRFKTVGKFKPYLIAGGGLYSYRPFGSNLPSVATASESDFGINAGAGFEYMVNNKVGLFLEPRFHNVFVSGTDSDNLQVLPISVGARISLGR